ncbi:hypothetical protein EPN44_14360 [bacterium]|nr:MAG: hypothetical protein EPN44_14360 [bacterium]
MVIYFQRHKVIGRSAGRSVVAAAACRSGERLVDERLAREYDYTRRGVVAHREILAPEGAPAWVHDRARLWNEVERAEKRRDAQLAREFVVAIPRELGAGRAGIDLVRSWAEQLVAQGMVVARGGQRGAGRGPGWS